MIAHLRGKVAEKSAHALVLDVAGVGYEVQVAGYEIEAAPMGETVQLFTYYHVRENAHELFGFSSLGAKRLFELLISVSGVGPKMALSILGLGDAELIRAAIAGSDSKFIQRAAGVGKRLAERIAVDLKDKIGYAGVVTDSQSTTGGIGSARHDDALDALLALGYSLAQASEALQPVDNTLAPELRVKEALKHL